MTAPRNSIQQGAKRALSAQSRYGAWAGFQQQAAKALAPSAATTPPPATAAAPTFNASALPVDPNYDAQEFGLQSTRDNTLAGLTQQRASTLGNAGYTAAYDSQGNATGLAFDPNNPYSQAALARKVYQQHKTGTTNSYAAQGQLYAGSLNNAQDANDQGFAVGEDARQKALLGFLAQNLIGQTSANNAFQTGSAQAYGDRVNRALASFLAQNQ